MDNVVMILLDEKKRLENNVELANMRFKEVCKKAIVPKKSKNIHGEDIIINSIDLDLFTPEEKEQFEFHSKNVLEHRARLSIFESFIRSHVSLNTIDSYDKYIEPLEKFKDISISCNNITLDENGDFAMFSIKVGPCDIQSRKDMTIEEYRELYTSALEKLLNKIIGQNISSKQAIEQIQNACIEIYLSNKKENSLSLTK